MLILPLCLLLYTLSGGTRASGYVVAATWSSPSRPDTVSTNTRFKQRATVLRKSDYFPVSWRKRDNNDDNDKYDNDDDDDVDDSTRIDTFRHRTLIRFLKLPARTTDTSTNDEERKQNGGSRSRNGATTTTPTRWSFWKDLKYSTPFQLLLPPEETNEDDQDSYWSELQNDEEFYYSSHVVNETRVGSNTSTSSSSSSRYASARAAESAVDASNTVTHFCFLMHGYRGLSRDLNYMESVMRKQARIQQHQKWITHLRERSNNNNRKVVVAAPAPVVSSKQGTTVVPKQKDNNKSQQGEENDVEDQSLSTEDIMSVTSSDEHGSLHFSVLTNMPAEFSLSRLSYTGLVNKPTFLGFGCTVLVVLLIFFT
jgi:hypothetical protein